MPRYEFRAFLTVEADTREAATKIADECADELSAPGEFSWSIDDGEPDELDDDE